MRHLFRPLLFTLILAGFLFGAWRERSDKTVITTVAREEIEGVPLRKQADAERIFRQRSAERVLKLSGGEGTGLYGPFQVKEGPHEDIFLLDLGDLVIKRFSPAGKLLTSYGKGKGQGPGEFTTITDFDIADNGEVWAADPNNGRLTVFAPDGRLDRTIRLEHPPYRLSLGHGGGYFVTFMLTRDLIFGRFAHPQQSTREFGNFLEQQSYNAVVLDGWSVQDGRGGFVYGAFFAGLLVGYDAEGHPRFFSELLGRPEPPKIMRDSAGRRWVDREALVAASSVSTSPRGIHALGIWKEGLRTRGAIDTYDLEDGSYRESMRLPENCEAAVMSARHLYTISEASVSKWRLDA